MNCPRCKNELKSVLVKDVTLDVCDSCEGIWFDNDELSLIIKSTNEEISNSSISKSLVAGKNIPSDGTASEISCPKCELPMQWYSYCCDSGIKLDKCHSCNGIWVDDGELKGIIDYLDNATAPLPPEKLAVIQSKLAEIEANFNQIDEEIVDNMVKSDEKQGIVQIPGKALQSIYRFFYKIGL